MFYMDDFRVSRWIHCGPFLSNSRAARISLLCEDRIFIHEGWSRLHDFGDGDFPEIDLPVILHTSFLCNKYYYI